MTLDVYEYNRCVNGDQTTVTISKAIMHPAYSSGNMKNDLCILKTNSDVHGPYATLASSRIDPQPFQNTPYSKATVAGWGTTKYGGSVPCQLQKVTSLRHLGRALLLALSLEKNKNKCLTTFFSSFADHLGH